MRAFSGLVILACLAVLFCEKHAVPFSLDSRPFVLGDTLVVRMSETWADVSHTISVRFDFVTEDSRCPLNMMCVIPGNAKVMLTCANGAESVSFELNTFYRFLQDTIVFGCHVELLDVMPHRLSELPIPKADYSVKLVVE